MILLVTGCVINGDRYPRPSELVDDWMVDRTRLLGVAASPPEVEPGATVAFSALIGRPVGDEELLGVAWIACPVEGDGIGFGCATDLTNLDVSSLDPEALAELGLIGFEPGLAPVYEVPPDLLDDVPAEDRAEGVYVLATVAAFPLEPALAGEPLDVADVESGYKRLVVSEAATPNHNPEIAVFTLDGAPIPRGAPVYVDPDQVYAPGIVLTEDAVEAYEFAPDGGPVETRAEEPYASWFTTGGEMVESVTLYPFLDAIWLSPPTVGEEGVWYAVVRDRRGGMAWMEQRWVVGP
jgi:hypothetical protein